MTRFLKRTALGLLVLVLLAAAGLAWYVQGKQPQRSGSTTLKGLQAPVSVRYDERGVPHIEAGNEADMYRAFGYLHAQDRLFQMEVARRLARGELAEILGPKLVDTDRLFRTLALRAHADATIETIDKTTPAYRAVLAYLDGVNQFQASHPAPIEFDILGIPQRPFTPQDTLAVAGYLAFSFASAFKTEPVMTYIRDALGPRYLTVFDLQWYPRGVDTPSAKANLAQADWQGLERVSALVRQVMDDAPVPPFEGSNAWAIAGSRTASGKPMLAGDPHIGFSAPAVWYATNEVPVFHYMPHRNLLAFKLYIWSRINWHLPEYARAKFSPEEMYAAHPEIEQHRQEICAFYAQVPTREYWPLHILDHTLNQIRHCAQARFFAQPEMPGLLLAELRTMLHTNLEAAYRGNKSTGMEAGAAGPGASFELFFNEIAYTNNIILVFTDAQPVALYTTLDNPNFIRSLDAEMCRKMAQWLGNIEQSSVQISHRGERQRHGLFEDVQAKIEALERELGQA